MTSLPIAQYKGLQDGSAPQNFPNRSKLSPRSADDIKLGTLLGSTLLHARYVCISVHSPSCVSYLCLIFSFQMFLKEIRFVFGSSFSVVPIFLCFLFLQIFLRKLWLVFHPSLSLCILSFCASVPCRCSCESFGVFSVPIFLCVSCHNQPSHSPIVLPPTCQPRQISGKKSFQQKSLAHFSP